MCHPICDISFYDQSHGLYEAEQILGMALTNAVDGETAGHAVQADNLAPWYVHFEELSGNRTEHISDWFFTRDSHRDLEKKL